MAVQLQGNGGTVAEVDGTTFRAMRTVNRPVDYGANGMYRVSVATGTLAAALAAAAQIFQFKWTDATKLAVIFRIQAQCLPLTLFTAATLTDHTSLDAFMVRSYAAGGGGTALTLTGNNAKLRTSMATSLAAINVSTTAALTAATTLDTQPFEQSLRKGNRVNPAAATEEVLMAAYDLNFSANVESGRHPLILAQNEGFVIRNRTVWPAAGTAVYTIQCEWAEVSAF
jgi:hypothetical protein